MVGRLRLISIALVALAEPVAVLGAGPLLHSGLHRDPERRAGARAAVMVGPVSIPAAVDQPQFVVQVASNRVEIDEFNRWDAPLNDSIARAVAGDLTVLLGTPNVAAAPFANFDPAYRSRSRSSASTRFVARRRWSRRCGPCARPRAGKRAQAVPLHARRCRVKASTRSPLRTAARSRA